MEDPNWFFSTLAQSAAAIVGLIGAFLVSRIVEQANEVRGKKKELYERIINLKVEIDQVKDDLRNLKERYSSIEKSLKEESIKDRSSVTDPYLGIKISLPNENLQTILEFFSNGTIILIGWLDLFFEIGYNPSIIFEKEDEFYTAIPRHLGQLERESLVGIDIYDKQKLINYIKNISELVFKFLYIRNNYQNFKNSFVLPSYFKYGLYILGFIAVFCVIAPLFFLSAGSYVCVKIALLTLFTIGIISLLIFFKRQIDEIENFVKTKF